MVREDAPLVVFVILPLRPADGPTILLTVEETPKAHSMGFKNDHDVHDACSPLQIYYLITITAHETVDIPGNSWCIH